MPKNPKIILASGAAVFVVLVMALAGWKWAHGAYNGIDLAYFSQAVWNTAHLRPFAFTIHPGLTLGDHAEWVLVLLALPYAVLPHPLLLVFIQAGALAAGALAVHRIAARPLPSGWALGAALGYLFLPTIGGAALFEFHALALAVPLLLFAADAFLEKRFFRFLIFLAAALLVREDVALVAAMFGIIAAMERRPLRWILAPLVLSAGWFVAMLLVIKQFSVGGGFKFFAYYGWLWPFDLGVFVRHLLRLTQLEFLLALLMPVLFLPLLRPKWLLLSLPGWLLLALSSSGAGAGLLGTHYALLLIPGFVLATLDGLAWARQAVPLQRILPGTHRERVIALVLATAVIFSAVALGPFVRGAVIVATSPKNAALPQALALVPPEASVAASARFLPHLAQRSELYALHYLMLGTTQFAEAPYDVPAPEFLLYDESDLLAWHANFPTLGWTRDRYRPGFARLRALIDRGGYGVVFRDGGMTLWQRGAPRPQLTGAPEGKREGAPGIRIVALREPSFCPGRAGICPLLVFTSDDVRGDDLLLRFYENKTAPRLMTFGVVPTFSWAANIPITVPVTVLSPDVSGPVSLELVSAEGDLILDPLGTAAVSWREVRAQGPAVTFTPSQLPAPSAAPAPDANP
ncbi:DUF2079 domain-containing protein [Patescibacteria group bacterium]|nr:MAG: DUF2079 domain-containing protein [Patescibacteria group bacterium]